MFFADHVVDFAMVFRTKPDDAKGVAVVGMMGLCRFAAFKTGKSGQFSGAQGMVDQCSGPEFFGMQGSLFFGRSGLCLFSCGALAVRFPNGDPVRHAASHSVVAADGFPVFPPVIQGVLPRAVLAFVEMSVGHGGMAVEGVGRQEPPAFVASFFHRVSA